MSKIKIEYCSDLEPNKEQMVLEMISNFKKEVYGSVDALVDYESRKENFFIIEYNDEVIGLVGFSYFEEFGSTKVLIDVAYVKKEYRKTNKAFMLILSQIFSISYQLELPVLIPCWDEALVGICKRYGSRKLYELYEYDLKNSMEESEKLLSKIYKGAM